MRTSASATLVLSILFALPGCAGKAALPPEAGMGPNPVLPAPDQRAIPTVKIAPAIGWPAGAAPTPPPGFTVTAFATGLDHPRWLHVMPNGDVLVAESQAPAKPEDEKGIRGMIMKSVMKKAGSGTRPSADRITLLRDTRGSGVADMRSVFLKNLHSPFGMALVGNELYVANTDAVLRFPYADGQTEIAAIGTRLAELPAGPINHHWTKSLLASRDGMHLYATVGSNSNVGENGLEQENGRACILQIERATGRTRVLASGLRNPNGMDWQPHSGQLWTVVNERDELGNDLVPDYLTSVQDGGFYGWPYSYFGQHVDTRVAPQRPDLVARALRPDYALGSHVAPLGMVFYSGKLFPAAYQGGAFVGEHGSWNRDPPSGYKVVFVPFRDGKPAGLPQDFLTGFLSRNGQAQGRPVGVAIDRQGALLVADDVGNTVWRVAPAR